MREHAKQTINIPYYFILLTMTPIFALAFLLPVDTTTNFHIELNSFIDQNLLGLVGFWTSKSPTNSKLIANYISIFGPIFSLATYLKIRKTIVIDPNQYNGMTIGKYLLILPGMIGLVLFTIYTFYIQETDLYTLSTKWGFFGRHLITYTIFSSGNLLIFHCLPIFIHSAFYFIPQLLLKRHKAS